MFDQILGTIILVFFIGSICDPRNGLPDFLKPAFIGLLLTLIGITLGMNTGYAINPARDLGPRLLCWTAGYGERLFQDLSHLYWILVPVIGPLIGAVLGGWLYRGYQYLTDEARCLAAENEKPEKFDV
ncbi:unnamed protein product, partial [Mesorhabditis spiculigera]